MAAPVTDEQRIGVAWQVGESLARGHMPAEQLVTSDATLHGTMFDSTLSAVTEDLWERWRALVARFPEFAFHQRELHSAPGERVIAVGVAVSPGSSALTAVAYGFREAQIRTASSYPHPSDAFASVGLDWRGLGGGRRA